MENSATEAAADVLLHASSGELLNRSLVNASLDSSVLSIVSGSNCSPGGINPKRRESKSRAEKKRRDRINVCFQRMHQLLLEEEFKGGGGVPQPAESPGAEILEKAEILEQVICFVEKLKRERCESMPAPTAAAAAAETAVSSTPDRSRPAASDDSLIRSYICGYKKGIQNMLILIDRLCGDTERLTKAELIDKIKRGYLDNADSTATIGREKLLAAAVAASAQPASRPALGDLSNQRASAPPTPKKSAATATSSAVNAATATAAAALIKLSTSPNPPKQQQQPAPSPQKPLQPPAKKRRAFRELPATPELPRYEPISPGPYESMIGVGDDQCHSDGLWRPW